MVIETEVDETEVDLKKQVAQVQEIENDQIDMGKVFNFKKILDIVNLFNINISMSSIYIFNNIIIMMRFILTLSLLSLLFLSSCFKWDEEIIWEDIQINQQKSLEPIRVESSSNNSF